MQEPKIIQIIDNCKDKRKNICIVMPTFNQYSEIKKNIDLIKKQTLVPDIVIIDNNSIDKTFDKISEEYNDIILIKLAWNYWWAGWFYLWQKYAYENWYDWIILNDNDAYPVDNNLIENLLKNSSKNQFVFWKNNVWEFKKMWVVFHYWLLHRDIISKIWFVDFKLFLYWEDEDYLLKLNKSNVKLINLNVKYYHPFKLYISPIWCYFYVRNLLYLTKKGNIMYKFVRRLFLSFYLLFWKIYENDTTYKVAIKAVEDYKNNIFIDFVHLQDFINKLPKKDINTFNLEDLNKNKKNIFYFKKDEKLIKYWFSKNKYFFTKNLITYSYIKSFFWKKIYFLTNYDLNNIENNTWIIFNTNKPFLYKIIYFIKIYFYLIFI